MDPPSQESGESSPHSPTDTRRQSDSLLSESYQSTDTVRRRPDTSYGTLQTPPPAGSTSCITDSTSVHDRAYPRTGGSQPLRSPMLGPDRGRARPRKPPMTRRASSNAQAPHRGAVFSADDAVDEVAEEETTGERQHSFASPRPQYSSDSSRQPSTLRRRTMAAPVLSRVQSSRSDTAEEAGVDERLENDEQGGETQDEAEEEPTPDEAMPSNEDDDEEDDDVSDAESFTLKDRQQAINETHPFGIRLWKPALYKKDRSVQKTAEGDIHSTPGGRVSSWLLSFNVVWTLVFGWWMALIAALGAITCFIFAAAPSGRAYGRVLWGLAGYLFYPFGKFVRLEQDEDYLDEDQGEGRSISEYEQWQSGDLEYGRLFFGPSERSRSIVGRSRRSIDSEPSETDSLLGRGSHHPHPDEHPRLKRRLFGRGQWNIGRVIFFFAFYGLLTPSLIIVSGICWFLVFWIPMGKVTMLLFDHLRRHPLALSFESDINQARIADGRHSSILLCTYRAVGSKYWKYTIDGTNIFLINLMAVVLFVILDWLVLDGVLHLDNFLTSPGFLFVAGLFSIIPLAYFIGQAVASISAQSSMGLGAAINAFFSTIVEVFLYCVALRQGKGPLVEGSIIGSIFAGVLFLPGLSMCFGAIKRKTQRFNARSAGVTSTMLLFAVVAAFGPTLFYQIYGTHELNCLSCTDLAMDPHGNAERDCRRCYFSQAPQLDDRFYIEAVRPYCYAAAFFLFLSYVIGLWFTLRTHAAVIWNTEVDEKKHEEQQQHMARLSASDQRNLTDASGADIRDSKLYKRILGASLRHVGLSGDESRHHSRQPSSIVPPNGTSQTAHLVPPKTSGSAESVRSNVHVAGLSEAENNNLIRGVTELAATAAAIAARDARVPRHISIHGSTHASTSQPRPTPLRTSTFPDMEDVGEQAQAHGGHDAPNWSRMKSAVILMAATVLYAIVAEILVDTVDVVLKNFAIDEKFLGITLFALVPNTTEFLNAISFAMNGNIALSMEIGSAYALQVCLLQIPALVLFSAVVPIIPLPDIPDIGRYTFSLLFPQWDMVTVILCVFLLSYMYGEGKSNYFKGSILLLTYMVVVIGFYFSSMTDVQMGMNRFDTFDATSGWTSYKTIGRSNKGRAY
ncbi:Sodium/calcium exchanger protein-domain-containing protein [Pseudomassariella vexata]|uniref:Sodium/calcium exchanger protein-domain-containing protein n=1 Tax=Pseudomassariella vexata TaxID=1141098 RepID=A0A1Y2DY02_9PEZI|nr:Sodium/calcium exchanger protein-domain-containing protein [Pseudomassariella vexata]ORY64151.1 Sodium/calcium exchanger protein-domain-containing protein [Pseudomassariella vexata]